MNEDHLRRQMATFMIQRTTSRLFGTPGLESYSRYMLWRGVSRTFAPMWDVFRVSSDKLALCHLELMRKMNDLIREINKYGDEQVKIHRRVSARGRRAHGSPT